MRVELIRHTENAGELIAAAARVCYTSDKASEMIEKIDQETVDKMIKVAMDNHHDSILEHISFTFLIEDVSRALTHQLVRHRLCTYHQRSQRYVEVDDLLNNYVAPESIRDNIEAKMTFEYALDTIAACYKRLIEEFNIPKEDARYLLPNATTSQLIMTTNARNLIHIFGLRCCCYDSDTEVLTINGWKKFGNITSNDLFYSMNPETFEVELVASKKVFHTHYSGTMINVRAQSIDLKVTPNHKNFVSHSREKHDYKFEYALCHDQYRLVGMKKNCVPIKGMLIDTFVIPGLKVKDANQYTNWERVIPDKEVDIHDLMLFVGMYLSDGYVVRAGHHYNVGICKNDIHTIRKFIDVMSRLSDNSVRLIEETRSFCYKIEVHDRRLYEFCKKFGKTHDKHIPNEFFRYDHTILLSLFEGFLYGDCNAAGTTFSSTSKRLADDFQRLLLHIGFSGTITMYDRTDDVHFIKERNSDKIHLVSGALSYNVSINRSKNEPFIKTNKRNPLSYSNYDGIVHCVELEKHHLLYVRRNGKAVWSGNSRAQNEIHELADRMLQKCREVLPSIFNRVGPNCYNNRGFCPEGKMHCGKRKLVMDRYNPERTEKFI